MNRLPNQVHSDVGTALRGPAAAQRRGLGLQLLGKALIFKKMWLKTHNIKFTILTIFKCIV